MKKIKIFVSISFLMYLNMFSQESWTSFTNSGYLKTIVREDNYIWTGGSGGLLKWDLATSKYIKYTMADGMANNDVTAVVIDSKQNKWIGLHANWISKFDGSIWETISCPVPTGAMAIDQFDNIWIISNSGIYKYNGAKWTTYYFSRNLGRHQIITVDLSNVVWAGTEYGVGRFDGTNWKWFDNVSAKSMVVDLNNHKWFLCGDSLIQFDNKNWTSFFINNSNTPSSWFHPLAVDTKNNIWTINTEGVWMFSRGVWSCQIKRTDLVGMNYYKGPSFYIDSKDNLWFSGYGKVEMFNRSQWFTYSVNNEIGVSSYICDITVDKIGQVWVAGYYGGLSKYNGDSWKYYSTPPYNQSIIADSENNLWIGTEQGLKRFDGNQWLEYPQFGDNILSIAIDSKNIKWIGTGGIIGLIKSRGLFKFNDSTWTVYQTCDGLPDNSIRTIAIDKQDNVWVGTGSGVAQFDGQKWTTYTRDDGLGSNDIQEIGIDLDGNKWFAAFNGGGITKFDDTHWIVYSNTEGYNYSFARDIAVDSSGNIWVVHNGVSKFDGEKWTQYYAGNGLLGDARCIAIDRDNNKWVGTEHGVSMLNENTVTVPLESKTQNQDFQLEQNYPNPFNVSTQFFYVLTAPKNIKVIIYDLLGREIKTLLNIYQTEGKYSISWHGYTEEGILCSSGIYWACFHFNNQCLYKKMILIK